VTPASHTPERSGPPRRTLLALALLMVLVHLALLLGVTRTLDWSLQAPTTTAPLQTRMIAPPPPIARPAAPAPTKAPARRVSPTAAPAETPPENANAQPLAEPPAAEPATAEPPTAVASAEPAASAPLETPAPVQATPTTASWPTMALGALPPPSLMSYQLTGMDLSLIHI
jgi:hypothetical protein